jgi:hypothetical protein
MANVNDNLLVKGAKGNVNKQFVLRTRANKTSIAKMPVQKKGRVATEKQTEKRTRFHCASLFAQGAMASKHLKKKYAKKAGDGITVFNVAFRDFMVKPEIKKINSSNYNGEIGSCINIRAKDDFRVIAVKLKITNAEGMLIEEGNAILDPLNRKNWIYSARVTNIPVTGSVIVATAFDIPNNRGTLEISV